MIQKSEFLIGNTKIEIVMQAGFAGVGYDEKGSMHCHPNFEVHYIEEGSSIFCTEENQYVLEKDTLVLIPAKIYHFFEMGKDNSTKTSFEIRLTRSKSGKELFSEYERIFSLLSSPLVIRGFMPEMSMLSSFRGIIRGEEEMSRINACFTLIFHKICDVIRFHCDVSKGKSEERTAEINSDDENVTLMQILGFISKRAREPIKISDLASYVNLSERQIQRILSGRMNEGFHSILTRNRIAIAKTAISESPSSSLEKIAYESGFSNYVSFWNQFKRHVGCSPEEYKTECISKKNS